MEAADAHLIKGGSTAITDYVADPIVFNYCRHEGYRLTSCDEGRASSVLRSQVKAGKNLLMLQFENAADYAQAAAWWDGDAKTANRVLWDAGLSGAYVYWLNEDMKTIMIGLDPGQ